MRLPRIILLLPLFAMVSLSGASILLPTNGTECDGYFAEGGTLTDDSVTDLTWVSVYGDPVTWRYVLQGDTAYAELRGESWRSYVISGDTLLLTHMETSRERSDLRVALGFPGNPRTYVARSRREMSFCYLDSGTYTTAAGVTPLLILAEGDTIRNCPYMETSARFGRSLIEEDSDSIFSLLGTIEDSERVWHLPGSATPLAVSTSHTVLVPDREESVSAMTYVFPRDMQPQPLIEDFAPQTMDDTAPLPTAVTLEGPTLSVGSDAAEILVCDISGKVWLSLRSSDTPLDLSGLPAGTYVVSFSRHGQPRESHVIILE